MSSQCKNGLFVLGNLSLLQDMYFLSPRLIVSNDVFRSHESEKNLNSIKLTFHLSYEQAVYPRKYLLNKHLFYYNY